MRFKYQSILFYALAWFFLMGWSLTDMLGYLLLSGPMDLFANYFLIPSGFFLILFVDYVSKESVDPLKLMIMTTLSILLIISSFEQGATYSIFLQSGEQSLIINGNFRIMISITGLFMGLMFVYYSAKIHLATPKSLKSYSVLFLLGAILIGFVSPGSVAIGLSLIIPGCYDLFMATGALLCAIVIGCTPKLTFILPFKVYKLMVFETTGGIPLFIHAWSKSDEKINSMVFSGMMHAMNKFTEISLQRNIREIHLEQIILILQRSDQFPIVCMLIASKSSKFLRAALYSFSTKFIDRFSEHLSTPTETNDFKSAVELIHEHFAFVPEYE